MTELVLCMDGDSAPGGAPKDLQVVLWSGRRGDCHSLERMVDQRLLELRRKHAHWAFAVGFADDLQGHLECGERPSMWWTSTIYERHPRVSPNLYPMYKLACLEILLLELPAHNLTVRGGSRRLRELVRQIAIANGVACHFERGPLERQNSKPLQKRLYTLIPAPLRAIARFGWWLASVKRKLSAKPRWLASPGYKTGTIVTYFPNVDMEAAQDGRFRSRYWNELHDALDEQARLEGAPFVRWLFIHFPAPGLNLDKCVALRDIFQARGADGESAGISFNFLEEFLTIGGICSGFLRWLKLLSASLRHEKWFASQCSLEDSRFNFWPLLRWEWAESMRGWRGLERCLFNQAFRRYCQLAGAQRWTLYALENCPWERMLTAAARKVCGNGPILGAQHSTIRPTDFRYFDDAGTFSAPVCAAFQPDTVAGNGASACAQWLANGLPQTRLRQVEALRYLYLAKRKDSRATTVMAETLTCGRRLLIATSFFPGETAAHLDLVRECLAAGILDAWEIVLKPHPYLRPEAWLAGLPVDQAKRIAVTERPVDQELTPGTRVWASNSTTVALEAAISGLPVMVMAADDDFDLCPIQDVPGLVRTATPEDVAAGLEGLEPLPIPPDYLNLDVKLPGWRTLLDLRDDASNGPAVSPMA